MTAIHGLLLCIMAAAAAALLAFVIAPGLAYQWRTRRRGRP